MVRAGRRHGLRPCGIQRFAQLATGAMYVGTDGCSQTTGLSIARVTAGASGHGSTDAMHTEGASRERRPVIATC